MLNPYADRPDRAFWSRAVAAPPGGVVDPVASAPFRIGPADPVATAGSCFAQHIARHLAEGGFTFLRTEQGEGAADPHGYDLFSARYGNIYTVRQMLQLFDEAYGLFEPADAVWTRPDGRFVDAFRPRISAEGFAEAASVLAARERHLAAVRRVFEECAVFVFTLGLTEAWVSEQDGAAYPLAPGVVASGGPCRFHNFGVEEVREDLLALIARLREVNPGLPVVLTVSPVPLVATATEEHVLVATTFSKSVLRVAAAEVAARLPDVAYFPSYEIITGPQARGRYFEANLRGVTPEGVAAAMAVFERHYLTQDSAPRRTAPAASAFSATEDNEAEALLEILCDEEAIEAELPAPGRG